MAVGRRSLGRAALASLLVFSCPSLGAAADLESGRKTFVSICSGCHGIDGRTYGGNAPSFARGQRLDKNDATLMQSVRDGTGGMPPWGGYLNAEQIADVVAYVRTLAPPRTAQ